MDKGAGFNISVGIDMQVISSSGNTAAYIFPIVPESTVKMGFVSR